MTAIPDTCREVRLKARPDGMPKAENFEIVSVPLPIPMDGEVLVRNRYFLVSASLRMMISKGAEDVEGVPFPALREGDALAGEALGEIVLAPAGSGFSPGDLVLHFRGWREYATVPIAQCRPVEPGLRDPVGYLGHGWTAYAALTGLGASDQRGMLWDGAREALGKQPFPDSESTNGQCGTSGSQVFRRVLNTDRDTSSLWRSRRLSQSIPG